MAYLALIWASLTFILGFYNESKIKKLEKRIEELEKINSIKSFTYINSDEKSHLFTAHFLSLAPIIPIPQAQLSFSWHWLK